MSSYDNTDSKLKNTEAEEGAEVQPKVVTGCKKFFFQDDHLACAKLNESNFKCIGPKCLAAIKIVLFLPMFSLALYILITKPKDFFLMESYWGFHVSWISLLFSVLSHWNQWFLSLSVLSSELAWGFNLFIVPFYWEFEW